MAVLVGLPALDALRPAPPLPVLRPVGEGTFVEVTFREATTAAQEESFLCTFVYSACTASGHKLRPGVMWIGADSRKLSIGTTPEFQMELLDIVSKAAIVEAAVAGFK